MKKAIWILFAAGLLAATGRAQSQDDFQRERKSGDARSEAKDALEGKAPPPLVTTSWMNTGGRPLKLAELAGKVVVLKFWGTW